MYSASLWSSSGVHAPLLTEFLIGLANLLVAMFVPGCVKRGEAGVCFLNLRRKVSLYTSHPVIC